MLNLQKKNILLIMAVFSAVFLLSNQAIAHSGRTDSSGGHNCNVGSCAGTYHFHNSGSYTPPAPTYTPPTTPKQTSPSNYTVPAKSNSLESTSAKPADIKTSSSSTEDDSFGGGLALGALGAGAIGWYINKKNKK